MRILLHINMFLYIKNCTYIYRERDVNSCYLQLVIFTTQKLAIVAIPT